MNNSLRDVAKILYNVPNSVCCKVCTICKQDEGNEHLSCADCIEKGLQELINKETPKKPYKGVWKHCCPNCHKYKVLDNEYGTKFKRCSNCGQNLDWSDWSGTDEDMYE